MKEIPATKNCKITALAIERVELLASVWLRATVCGSKFRAQTIKRQFQSATKKTVNGGKKAIATRLASTSRSKIGKSNPSRVLKENTAEHRPISIVRRTNMPVVRSIPVRFKNSAPTKAIRDPTDMITTVIGLWRTPGSPIVSRAISMSNIRLATSSLHCGLRPYAGEPRAGEVFLIHHATRGQSRISVDFLCILAFVCMFYHL